MEPITIRRFLILLTIVVGLAAAQQQPGRRKRPQQQSQQQPVVQQQKQQISDPSVQSSCPEPNGFFPDAYQCDKYYKCTGGQIQEKLCADGLVFIDAGPKVEKCEFSFAVDCTGREELQPAQSSLNCPRKNGYFAHEDTSVCNKFFFCVDGHYNAITCPDGLVFSNKTGTCTWPDLARKQFCSSGELFDFDCPKIEGELQAGQMIHPRYADPKDCQFFYVCIDGKVPRKNGCPNGKVYNEKTGMCAKPKDVPECKDWYKGILDYDEDGEIATTPKPKPSTTPGAAGTRRKVKRPTTRPLVIQDDA